MTLAFAAGFVAEVGLFASRYVGRLAERDLLGLAPLLFLGLCLWLDRGAPRRRASSYIVAFAAAALVLALPLGRLVHKAALPDAFTLIPSGSSGATTSSSGRSLPSPCSRLHCCPRASRRDSGGARAALRRHVDLRVALCRRRSLDCSRGRSSASPTRSGSTLRRTATSPYLYDGEAYWNAVWSYVFWNRKLRRVYVLAERATACRAPSRSIGSTRSRSECSTRTRPSGSSARRRRSPFPASRSQPSRRSGSDRTASRCGEASVRSGFRPRAPASRPAATSTSRRRWPSTAAAAGRSR